VCIPADERESLVRKLRDDSNHVGRDLLLATMHKQYYWPAMARDISPIIVSCTRCQQFGERRLRGKLKPITQLAPMRLLSMDYVSLPKTKGGWKSVLAIIVYFSRYVWAHKFKGEGNGKKTVEALQSIFRQLGVPRIIMSDGGKHLDCKEVNNYLSDKGILRHITPAYEPSTNGLVENANRLLIRALERATAGDIGGGAEIEDWPKLFDEVSAKINRRIVSTTGHSPNSLMFAYEWKHDRSVPDEEEQLTQAEEIIAQAVATITDRRLKIRSNSSASNVRSSAKRSLHQHFARTGQKDATS